MDYTRKYDKPIFNPAHVMKALQYLPPKWHVIIKARHVDWLKIKEISKITGQSTEVIDYHLARMKPRLKDVIFNSICKGKPHLIDTPEFKTKQDYWSRVWMDFMLGLQDHLGDIAEENVQHEILHGCYIQNKSLPAIARKLGYSESYCKSATVKRLKIAQYSTSIKEFAKAKSIDMHQIRDEIIPTDTTMITHNVINLLTGVRVNSPRPLYIG